MGSDTCDTPLRVCVACVAQYRHNVSLCVALCRLCRWWECPPLEAWKRQQAAALSGRQAALLCTPRRRKTAAAPRASADEKEKGGGRWMDGFCRS